MKTVLITGGSGSFGRAFTQRLLKDRNIERIVIYSRGEHAQEEMARELTDYRMRFFIGDVRDRGRLELAMRGIDTVVHAAALKIVPTAEYNPTECIATNIGGAENVVTASIRARVKRVIALSTDKAVNPINLYGASKLAAEKVFVAANYLSAVSPAFSVVRYGNVAGSKGSVIPLFRKLVAAGELSLPVTDPRMTRFNITMDRAIDLVMLAAWRMKGREIFVPRIPSINIVDVVKAFGCSYKMIGIRPGEKLHECLLTEDEARNATRNKDTYIIYPELPKGVTGLHEGFRYTSDTNDHWLTVEQIKESLNV